MKEDYSEKASGIFTRFDFMETLEDENHNNLDLDSSFSGEIAGTICGRSKTDSATAMFVNDLDSNNSVR